MPGKVVAKDKGAKKKSKKPDAAVSKGSKSTPKEKPKKEKKSKGVDGSKKGSRKGKGKGKKGKKKGKKKKKGPRCPVVRFKKALKNVCYDNEHPTAVLNSYFVCHGVQEMLKFRKFVWKKKQKPIPPLEPEPKFADKPWGFG